MWMRLFWFGALLWMSGAAFFGMVEIYIQATSAPQQAAAAGIACFQIVLPYVMMRAVEGMQHKPAS